MLPSVHCNRTAAGKTGSGANAPNTSVFICVAYHLGSLIPVSWYIGFYYGMQAILFMDVNFKRYFLYLVRWQLSTPILAGVLYLLGSFSALAATIIANIIGGLIFFWVDRFIFTSQALAAQWEVREEIQCADCGRIARGYRLVQAKNYDRTRDPRPEFRCESCSAIKSAELKRRGIPL